MFNKDKNQMSESTTPNPRQVTEAIARSLDEALNTVTVHPDDERECAQWLYCHRLLNDYQAFILLAEKGMQRQCQIMMRCILEIVFEMVAWERHPALQMAMINGDDSDRRQVLEKLLELQQSKATMTENELAQLNSMVRSADEMDRKSLPTVIKAEFADLLQLYRTDYQLLSETVHSEAHDIKADMVRGGGDERILEIHTLASDPSEMDELMLQTAEYVLKAYQAYSKLSSKVQSDDLAELDRLVQNCWHHHISPVPHKK